MSILSHDERPWAEVLVFICSDYRLHRSASVAVLEQHIDRLGAEHGLIVDSKGVDFQLIAVPGVQHQLSNPDDLATIRQLHAWAQQLVHPTHTKLIVLTYHVGQRDSDGSVLDQGCCFEGDEHMNGAQMRRKCVLAIQLMKSRFPNVEFEIAMLGVEDETLKYVERIHVSDAEFEEVADEFSELLDTFNPAPNLGMPVPMMPAMEGVMGAVGEIPANPGAAGESHSLRENDSFGSGEDDLLESLEYPDWPENSEESINLIDGVPTQLSELQFMQIVTRVLKVANDHFNTEENRVDVVLDSRLVEDLGADSVSVYAFDTKLEGAFTLDPVGEKPISLTEDDVNGWVTLRDVVHTLARMNAMPRGSFDEFYKE